MIFIASKKCPQSLMLMRFLVRFLATFLIASWHALFLAHST